MIAWALPRQGPRPSRPPCNLRTLFAFAGAVLLISACDRPSPEGPAVAAREDATRSAAPSRPLSAIDLTPTDSAELTQWIAEQPAPLVLVDFWATWCGPCVEKLPDVAEIARQFRDQGVQVIGVSFDELSETEKVIALLAKKGVDFPQRIARLPTSDAFADFDLDQLPTYRLFRSDGSLIAEYTGDFEFVELQARIRQVLDDGRSPAP